MSSDLVLTRLRRFLLALSGILLVGALIELSFTNHTEEPLQWIPFILCALGTIAIGVVLVSPQRKTLLALRASMGMVFLGSLFGMYEHIENNVAFQLEIQPNLTAFKKLAYGLGGANPLLAPGILGIAALLAIAATYYHPALGEQMTIGEHPD